MGGPETAAFRGALRMQGPLPGEGAALTGTRFPGSVRLSRAIEIGKGVPRLLGFQGTRRSHALLGSGWTAQAGCGIAQGRVSGARPSLRPPTGPGRGIQDAAPRTTGRAEPERPARPQPARAPDSPAWWRQDPCVAAAPGARPGPPVGGSSTPPPPRPAPLPPLSGPSRTLSTGND